MLLQDDKDNKDRVEEGDHISRVVGLEDPDSVSAFEVYSKRSQQHVSNSKSNKTKQRAATSTTSNPVRLVQEAARKFGLMVLSSELDKVRYSDGTGQLIQEWKVQQMHYLDFVSLIVLFIYIRCSAVCLERSCSDNYNFLVFFKYVMY